MEMMLVHAGQGHPSPSTVCCRLDVDHQLCLFFQGSGNNTRAIWIAAAGETFIKGALAYYRTVVCLYPRDDPCPFRQRRKPPYYSMHAPHASQHTSSAGLCTLFVQSPTLQSSGDNALTYSRSAAVMETLRLVMTSTLKRS